MISTNNVLRRCARLKTRVLGKILLFAKNRMKSVAITEGYLSLLDTISNSHKSNIENYRVNFTKANRLVIVGFSETNKKKLYEAGSQTHSGFVEYVANKSSISHALPIAFSVNNHYILTDWVEGKPLNTLKSHNAEEIISKMARMQHSIHQISISDLPTAGFCYWSDYIYPRFFRAAALLGEADLARKINLQISSYYDKKEKHLIHPDLTLANIVLTKDNEYVIIDNELISIGAIPLLDVCNSVHSMKWKDANTYIKLYLNKANPELAEDDYGVLRSAWFARKMGSLFVSGKIDEMQEFFRKYADQEPILPFDERLVKVENLQCKE